MTEKSNKVDQLLDELLKEQRDPRTVLSREGLLGQLTKRLTEKALSAELTAHLGYEAHERGQVRRKNSRNGTSSKTVLSEHGAIELQIPRDREGSFEPQLIPKHERRSPGFNDQVIALYARGLTVREIQGHLREMYGAEVSPALISAITEPAEACDWRDQATKRQL